MNGLPHQSMAIFVIAKDCLLTGPEQACSRITRLFVCCYCLSPCRKWLNTQKNSCWLRPNDQILTWPDHCLVDVSRLYLFFVFCIPLWIHLITAQTVFCTEVPWSCHDMNQKLAWNYGKWNRIKRMKFDGYESTIKVVASARGNGPNQYLQSVSKGSMHLKSKSYQV